jgi:hypothetical protein
MCLNSAIVVAIFFLLSTPFSFSSALLPGNRIGNSLMRFVPSLWFLGLCDSIRGPQLAESGLMSLWAAIGLLGTFCLVVATFGVNYRRHFLKTAENAEATAGKTLSGVMHLLGMCADRIFLQEPFERAGYRFTFRTLARSPRHRLVLSAFIGAGIVMSVQLVSMTTREPVSSIPSMHWLSIAFILNFCVISGLRVTFDIPAEIRANWTFQLLIKPEAHGCIPLARKVILSVVLPLTWTAEFLLYLTLWGWKVALIQATLITVASVFLTEIVLANFRKIPFTCRYPEFKQESIVGLLIVIFGFIVFSFATAALEHWALFSVWRLLLFVPFIAVGWNGLAYYRAGLMESERHLTFEEEAPPTVELLRLNME